jgi:NAD(P)-dependent dehydrogenase (short-subunit alcohol dehydrogenase family)
MDGLSVVIVGGGAGLGLLLAEMAVEGGAAGLGIIDINAEAAEAALAALPAAPSFEPRYPKPQAGSSFRDSGEKCHHTLGIYGFMMLL